MHEKDEVKSSCISFWIWGENKEGLIVNFDHTLSLWHIQNNKGNRSADLQA